jgi:hypothetical protein
MVKHNGILKILFVALFCLTQSTAVFPMGSCATTDCMGSPYDFVWTLIDQNAGLFCFDIHNKITAGNSNACATSFQNQFTKFVIKSQPICQNAFVQVNINGHKKGGGVFFSTFGINNSEAELRVTSMAYTNKTIPGNTFCLIVKPPCNDLATFCGGDTCYYSVYDPFTHDCCPVCMFRATNNVIYQPPTPDVQGTPPPPVAQGTPPPPVAQGTPPAPSCGVNVNPMNCTCSCTPVA